MATEGIDMLLVPLTALVLELTAPTHVRDSNGERQ